MRFAREHGGWTSTLTHTADVCQSGTTAPRVHDLLSYVQLRTGLALVSSPVLSFSLRQEFRSHFNSCPVYAYIIHRQSCVVCRFHFLFLCIFFFFLKSVSEKKTIFLSSQNTHKREVGHRRCFRNDQVRRYSLLFIINVISVICVGQTGNRCRYNKL